MQRIVVFLMMIGLVISPKVVDPGSATVVKSSEHISVNIYLPVIVKSPLATAEQDQNLEPLEEFIQRAVAGNGDVLAGVYVAGRFARTVVQQPDGDYGYISISPEVITQYMLAAPAVTGLLAHNHLAGKDFFHLLKSDKVILVAGDGTIKIYRVAARNEFRAVDPQRSTTDLIDLESGMTFTAAEVFARYYLDGDQVVFQTCIQRNGNPSWGRLFIVALPVDSEKSW